MCQLFSVLSYHIWHECWSQKGLTAVVCSGFSPLLLIETGYSAPENYRKNLIFITQPFKH